MSYDLGGGGGNSFPFENYGDSVTGTIAGVVEVQQTDLTTGALSFWPDGKPKMQHVATLQTNLRDDADDDGTRTVYLRGSRKPEDRSTLSAVLGAVKLATGKQSLDDGATLTLTYVGDRPGAQRGFVAKCYEATYVPPAPGSTDLGGGNGQQYPQQQPVQQALPIQQQPAYQQQAPPQYAPQQVAQQQPQQQPPAPPAGPPPGIAGYLNGSPITAAQAAGMRAAGVVPEQVAGWVSA